LHTKTGNIKVVKEINRSLVLNLIKDKGPISRATVSKLTKLTRSTVSNITDYYLKKNVLKEIGLDKSIVGRRGILLAFNSKAYYLLGIDLGTLKTTIIITDLSGKIEKKIKYPTNHKKGKEEIIEELKISIHSIIKKFGMKQKGIVGIGVAAPGLIDKKGRMIFAHNFGWGNVPLSEILSREFNLPVFVENNVNAMALAESEFGKGQGIKNFIFINVGMGIGSGIVINGEILHGENNCAGEVGHTTIKYDGPKCSCRNNGCLEVMASGIAIAKRAVNAINNGEKSLIFKLANYDLNKISAEIVVKAANQGDELGRNIIQEAGEYLGIGIANIVNLLNPSMVIVGGGISKAGDLIFKPLKRSMRKRSFPVSFKTVKIIPTSLGENCSVLGAIALASKSIFRITKITRS